MKKLKEMQYLIGGFILSTLLFSCSSEEFIGEIENENLEVALISSEQKVSLNINYDVPEGYKVLFDVYAENPYEIAGEGIGRKDINPIISGMTDDNGDYQISRIISGGVQEVYVLSKSVGVPALLHGKIEAGKVTPVECDLSLLVNESSVESRKASDPFLYLGNWNSWGRPNYIDKSKSCDLTSKELRTISQTLPEWKKVKKDYTDVDFIYVKEEAEVWISLLSAKSLFNNALGYYCYQEGMSKKDINEVIALPRTDLYTLNGNKGLKSGQYVKLKYLNPKTKKMENKFPAGSRIGWVLHRSGFNILTSRVNEGTYQFYSNKEWNPEKKNKNHTAIFSTSEGNIILAFEDLYNDVILSDNDCNDVVFHVSSWPENAISTKVEVPDSSEDIVEEEVDVIQPLTSIIDVPVGDKLANDLVVASKSTLEVKDGFVVGVKDVFYIANSDAMNDMITKTYSYSEMERKVVVRTTVKFARAEEEKEKEKKGRTVVRTTVKNTTWEVEEAAEARSLKNYTGDVSELILSVIDDNRQKLADGKCIRLEITMKFKGVEYKKFVESINLPPYSPFIEHGK